MQVHTTITGRGDEGDPEAATPIAKQVGETGRFVVFIWMQLRVGDDVHGHKEQPIADVGAISKQRMTGTRSRMTEQKTLSPLAVAGLWVTIGRHWYLFKSLTPV